MRVGAVVMVSVTVANAQERVLVAALRVLQSERAEPHADSDAVTEYANDLLALAVRDLTESVEAADSKPIGWSR